MNVPQNPSKAVLKEISKGREKKQNWQKFIFEEQNILTSLKSWRNNCKQKDLENQTSCPFVVGQATRTERYEEMSKQKEKETQLITEKLKCEEQKNTEISTRFEQTSEDLKKELAEAKNNNKTSMKQLKALMEKYERLKNSC